MKEKQVHVYLSEEAKTTCAQLQQKILEQKKKGITNSFEMQLLRAIERGIHNLKINPQQGIHIPRKNIPKQTAKLYNTNKLWKFDLFGFWRMMYTLTGDEVKIVVFILEITGHKEYNKRFDYRKR